jgi:hypothetical protein
MCKYNECMNEYIVNIIREFLIEINGLVVDRWFRVDRWMSGGLVVYRINRWRQGGPAATAGY